ncbi:MAG: chemotaxis protein CheB [Parasphingopyxis sp.]|nr:response regulator [Sphingomonadales bacterium]
MASRPQPIPPVEVAGRRCRVLIVDDSVVARLVIGHLLAEDGRFEIVGEATGADRALAYLAQGSCDIILLDIEMPGMCGLEALPLLREASDAAILVLSSHCSHGAEASIRAMTLGATDTLLKPATRNLSGDFARRLTGIMGRIAEARYPAGSAERSAVPFPNAPDSPARPVRCLAIGASTGGVHAMIEFLQALPPAIEMPILVTQHLPPAFIEPFANQMELATGRPFAPARDGQVIAPGQVLVAPGDAHMTVEQDGDVNRIRFRRYKAASGCMPSVDPMLDSVAGVYGSDCAGVILSGMGRDGAEGGRALADKGGDLLVQDQHSAVVWGMPGTVARQGIARFVADPARLARYVARRAGANGWG